MSRAAWLRIGLVGLVITLALLPGAARAQGPVPLGAGAPFLISTAEPGYLGAAVAYNPHDHLFLVVWEKEADGSIRGRYVSEGGGLLAGEFVLNSAFGAVDGEAPAVAYNSAIDEFLVVWSQGDLSTPPYGIYAQRLPGGGGPPLGGFWVSPDHLAYVVHVAANDHAAYHDFLVVWDSSYSVYARRVGGSPIGPRRTVAAGSGPDLLYDEPDVAYDAGHNRFLVVFRRGINMSFGSGESDIYARVVDADGVMSPGPTVVDGSGYNPGVPALAASSLEPDTPFLVVYEERLGDPSPYDITARLLDENGSPVSGWLCVACASGLTEEHPDIAGNDAFGYTIVWNQTVWGPPWPSYTNLWGRRAGPDAVLGPAFMVSNLGSSVGRVAVAGGTPLALVAWNDYRWSSLTEVVSGRFLGFQTRLPVTRR